MPGGNPNYYWDTCIFLAWLKNEQSRKDGEMDGVREQMDNFQKRRVSLMTCAMTTVEITEAKLPAGTIALLDQLMERSNFTRIGVDHRIATLARELRNYYINANGPDGMTLTVADSVHLAAAIIYRADEFHTFDEKDKPEYKALGLLPLSGNVAGHDLTICKPMGAQRGLALDG